MTTHQPSTFAQKFSKQLRSTRDKIASLPAGQRAYFLSLTDEVERIHYQMQEQCALIHDLVDDLRLREATAKLHLWVAALKTLREETVK